LIFGLACFLACSLVCFRAPAQNMPDEIQSITVLADSRLSIPMARIASRFTHENAISVACIFGAASEEEKKIENGDAADLFVTSHQDLIKRLKQKGLTDIYSQRTLPAGRLGRFMAVVVAGEGMTPARKFLDFLDSSEARDIFLAQPQEKSAP
jgi:ABC-type molybdate transport system substrate-binding protein